MLPRIVSLTIFILLVTNTLVMSEDHKAWALQQQERSQAMIKQFEHEALALTKRHTPMTALTPKAEKACRVDQNMSCSKESARKTSQELTLYIFVSFSMPKQTIKALAIEAKKHNASLVIRGLIQNSFINTAKFLQEMREGIVLDPTLFKEYDIKVVPTFVQKHKDGYL